MLQLGKCVSAEMIARRVMKTGDGTHDLTRNIWGYGDTDICKKDLQELDQIKT